MANRRLSKIVSYTTRPMRIGEINGVDYHFISESEFYSLQIEGFFAEHANYNGWNYAIAKKDCKNESIAVIEPHGFRQLKKIKDLNIISFYIKVSQKERLVRLAKRDDNIMEIFRRIISDQGTFQGIEDEVDYMINGEETVDKILDTVIKLIQNQVIRSFYESATKKTKTNYRYFKDISTLYF